MSDYYGGWRRVVHKYGRKMVDDLIESPQGTRLSERQKTIARSYLYSGKTFREVGAEFSVSHEAARKAVRKVVHYIEELYASY